MWLVGSCSTYEAFESGPTQFFYGDVGKVKRHSTDDDHTATITKLTSCDAIRVFASSSVDGSVKVWDGKHNLLLR